MEPDQPSQAGWLEKLSSKAQSRAGHSHSSGILLELHPQQPEELKNWSHCDQHCQ